MTAPRSLRECGRRDRVRVGIVGGGLAGVLLAWRLAQAPYRIRADLLVAGAADATGASGGLTRAFELDPGLCADAAESLAELRGTPWLRAWAGYREVGSVVVLPEGSDPTRAVATVEAAVGASARVVSPRELPPGHALAGLPDGAVCVVERRAGYIVPARLRDRLAAWLLAEGVSVRRTTVRSVHAGPRVSFLDGATADYDALVLATGASTPSLLRRSGLHSAGLRTKQIQYSLHRGRASVKGAFVDETTGLYGRPYGRDRVLVGVPGDRWNVEPGEAVPDPAVAARAAEHAARRLGPGPFRAPAERVVAAVDCYADRPGLRLRLLAAGAPLYTFTGGSGGSAKTALAASRAAAAALASL